MMWYALMIVLIIIASLLLILIILVQNPKGGGLSSSFGGVNQFGGVAQTNKMLERITWTLAIALVVFSLGATISLSKKQVQKSEVIEMVRDIDFSKQPTLPNLNNKNQ